MRNLTIAKLLMAFVKKNRMLEGNMQHELQKRTNQ